MIFPDEDAAALAFLYQYQCNPESGQREEDYFKVCRKIEAWHEKTTGVKYKKLPYLFYLIFFI